MATKKKAAPAPARKSKTDALSIRIDPRLRFGLELLARHQRRSVTGVVEWAIDEALRREQTDVNPDNFTPTFSDALRRVWRENELERLLALAEDFPHLLTYDEARMIDVLFRTSELLTGRGKLQVQALLPHWDELKPVLEAATSKSTVTGLTEEELLAAGLGWAVVPF